MKIINAGYEILPRPALTMVQPYLERIGRVCYKSEDKITNDSADAFLRSLATKNHFAMLEHYRFVLQVPIDIYSHVREMGPDLLKYLRFTEHRNDDGSGAMDSSFGMPRYIISASARGFVDLYDATGDDVVGSIVAFLQERYLALFSSPRCDGVEEFVYLHGVTLIEDTTILSVEERLAHETLTVIFDVDRGVTHELVRHRPSSFAQESTRYCNYSKDKFDNGITFINLINGITLDPKMKDMPEEQQQAVMDEWYDAMKDAERHYLRMLELGATAQIGRSVLPNSTKSQIVVTDTLEQWKNTKFPLRIAPSAHPQMREVMCALYAEVSSDPEYDGIFID